MMKDISVETQVSVKAGFVAELPALREERDRDAVSLYWLK